MKERDELFYINRSEYQNIMKRIHRDLSILIRMIPELLKQ